MKANEAPEKIYVHVRANKELGTTWHGKKITNSDIEYTRTDAFIEKALRWMISQGGINDALSREMIEDFRNHMKGK